MLGRRKEARFAAARGELAAAVVDLTEGAAELIAFGAMDSQLEDVRRRDAELTAIAARSAGTAGLGLAITTLLAGLACWGCLLVGIPAVISGQLNPVNLAVITLIPLAAFEIVVGLPVATQALQRVRQSAARVFDVADATHPGQRPRTGRPGTRRTDRPTGRSGQTPAIPMPAPGPAGRESVATRRTPGGARRSERSRQVDAGLGAGPIPGVPGRVGH